MTPIQMHAAMKRVLPTVVDFAQHRQPFACDGWPLANASVAAAAAADSRRFSQLVERARSEAGRPGAQLEDSLTLA